MLKGFFQVARGRVAACKSNVGGPGTFVFFIVFLKYGEGFLAFFLGDELSAIAVQIQHAGVLQGGLHGFVGFGSTAEFAFQVGPGE